MTEKLPTIKLKGKDYVQVKDRVLFFNETYPNGSIKTIAINKPDGSYAWFTAEITPDVSTPARTFIARSAGPIDEEKSYEKLETVAVGRALAFMGIGVIEGVASADEMQVFEERKYKNTRFENRMPAESKPKLEYNQGDKLSTGISQKSGKEWFAIDKMGGNRVFITKAQFEAISGNANNEQPSEALENLPF